MSLGTKIAAIALTGVLGFGATAAAGRCVDPGDVLDVPTPGYLNPGRPNSEQPNLFLETDAGEMPVTVVALTASRLQILIPATAPYDMRIKIRHHAANGSARTVANSRTCNQNGGGGSGGGGIQHDVRDLTKHQKAPLQRATKTEVAAPSGAPEVVLIGTAPAVSQAEALILAAGGNVLRSRTLANLGVKLTAVDLGGAMTLQELRAELARNAVAVTADHHGVYAAAQGPLVYAWPMIGINPASPCRLPRSVRIGIVDGPVDQGNPALEGVSIRSFSALNDGDLIGSTDHATGIASLIAGNGKTNLPAGLAQGAEIYSVVAFAKAAGRDVARLENIAVALDWMIAARVKVVNLSLAGPENDALEDIIRIADESGMILVAAADRRPWPIRPRMIA